MSGTSLDGLDGVLADFTPQPSGAALRVLAHVHRPLPPSLRAELLALNHSGADELHRAALAANALSVLEAEVVQALLAQADLPAAAVRAIGAHGQTLRHQPGLHDGRGYTLQLHNGALLAELTGIDVVCDFRTRDVAAGGQGAPLVCAFHQALFAQPGRDVAVLNLGGQSNLTLLRATGGVTGFDCGPANALLDGWCERHLGQPFDTEGRWATGGRVDGALLGELLSDPFFARRPPKSTGRDDFNLAWLSARLAALPAASAPRDVQATLAAFVARTVADALRREAPDTRELLVAGGGAFNLDLLQRLRQELPGVTVLTTDARGLDVNQVEATAFAWLAQAFIERRPGNRVEVTGARGPRVLGALHPA
ncbi:anhydro-N-acetylmuramic acid kinase [Azohydromonas sp. G-1-1-14]|uniref:Anhydro-N-acetylmuramic acid kinase n=2 Tax=Azohydromonas caseinilytica TaxID=2728836 RepID=A0A848F546_9BURK|nr:anhydro-N-acetylmuramic acid kinase [Azohydromonas caseinilytica]